jgi:hypothetical protein
MDLITSRPKCLAGGGHEQIERQTTHQRLSSEYKRTKIAATRGITAHVAISTHLYTRPAELSFMVCFSLSVSVNPLW